MQLPSRGQVMISESEHHLATDDRQAAVPCCAGRANNERMPPWQDAVPAWPRRSSSRDRISRVPARPARALSRSWRPTRSFRASAQLMPIRLAQPSTIRLINRCQGHPLRCWTPYLFVEMTHQLLCCAASAPVGRCGQAEQWRRAFTRRQRAVPRGSPR